MDLTKPQYDHIANILSGIGHIFFASVFLPYFIDAFKPSFALTGFMAAIAMWVLSVIVINRKL